MLSNRWSFSFSACADFDCSSLLPPYIMYCIIWCTVCQYFMQRNIEKHPSYDGCSHERRLLMKQIARAGFEPATWSLWGSRASRLLYLASCASSPFPERHCQSLWGVALTLSSSGSDPATSERKDSNSRHAGYKPAALTFWATFHYAAVCNW